MNHLVIMAGGVGSRFWPVSTPRKPKQFIDVLGTGRTLLQMTADRFRGICPAENVWVVTSVNYREIVREQLPDIPESNILLEPCMRNTAPCIAYAAWKIKMRDAGANLVVSPADHFVADTAEFGRVIREGLKFVEGGNHILTIGMCPSRAETGYGYIKVRTVPEMREKILEVEGFREKPDLQTARGYVGDGGYYWNAGIFLWSAGTLEKAFRRYCPEIAALFDSLDGVMYTEGEQEGIDRIFPECPNISIDYAVMEKAGNIYVFPADFGWSDLGTWGSLYERLPKDADGNAVVGGNVRMLESHGCIVRVGGERTVVLQGLEDCIVAEENGVMLVCRKADEQRIKEFSCSV